MNMIKALCFQVYEGNKRDFWLLVILSVGSAIIFQAFNVPILLQVTVILLLFLKTIFFVKSASIMPSLGADTNQFSWKYLQSLPINKRDLVVFLLLANLFIMSPMVIWFMSFQDLLVIQLFEIKDYNIFTSILIVCCLVPALMFLTSIGINTLVQSPRRQFARKHDKKLFFQKMRDIFIVLNVLIYGSILIVYVQTITKVEIFKNIANVMTGGFDLIIESPLLPLAIAALVAFAIQNTMRIWQREELSYTKINWKPRRDVPVMLFAVAMIYFPLSSISSLDGHYATHEILIEIKNGNELAVQNYLKRGGDPSLRNEHGLTPAIAAAMNGHLKILKILVDNGASRSGTLAFGKRHSLTGSNILIAAIRGSHHETVEYLLKSGESANAKNSKLDYYAIHMAAKTCSARIVDMIIENGADIKAVNGGGETALHMASRINCFASNVSLQEAGLDPLIKNTKGKIALDYLKTERDNNTRYYLEKISRLPASKGPIERAENNDNK